MAAYPPIRIAFAPYGSIPSGLDMTSAVYIQLGEAIEVFAKASITSGTLTLLKWLNEANGGAGAWYPYQNPMPIDSGVNNGKSHGRWMIDADHPSYWQMVTTTTSTGEGDLTISEAFMQGIRIG